MKKTIFEHKTLNEEIRAAQTAIDLHPMFHDQVQQQLYVSDADQCLFMASKWEPTTDVTDNFIDEMIDGLMVRSYYNLIEKKEFWIYPDVEHQARIVAGWEQFAKDMEAYEPEPEVIEAKAEPVMALPALSINVGGSISIQSNLEKFGERLRSFIEETNAKPETDQDFANLEQACKVLKEAEDALKQAESNALAQTASVDEMRRTVAYLAETARNNRLTFEKLVKSEKENRKTAIVSSAKNEFAAHCVRVQGDLPVVLNVTLPNFAEAIKGKKTLSSMQDAVNTMLANAKIEADALARDLREKLSWYEKSYGDGNGVVGFNFLFPDLRNLIYKQFDDFKLAVDSRVNQHKAQERTKAEEQAKAQAEREERIRREAEEKAQREAAQREEQIKREAAAKERERIDAEQEKDRAAQKAEQERQLDNIYTSEQDSGHQTQAVQAVDVRPIAQQDKPVRDVSIPSQSKVGVSIEAVRLPSRLQIISTLMSKYGLSEAETVKAIELAFPAAQQGAA